MSFLRPNPQDVLLMFDVEKKVCLANELKGEILFIRFEKNFSANKISLKLPLFLFILFINFKIVHYMVIPVYLLLELRVLNNYVIM